MISKVKCYEFTFQYLRKNKSQKEYLLAKKNFFISRLRREKAYFQELLSLL